MTTLTDTQVVTASGGLVELGYTSVAADVIVTSNSESSPTNITSTLTVVCDGSPVLVEFYAPYMQVGAGAGNWCIANLWYDGANYARIGNLYSSANVGTLQAPFHAAVRITPTAGTHTFQIRAWRSTADGVISSVSNNEAPAFLRVSKIVQATQWPAVTTGTIICTSTTRPASPFEGQKIYETDTDYEYRWSGSAWTLTGTLGSGFLQASSTTQQGPATTLTYTHATVTLTPGVWIVNSGMTVFNATTSDGTAVGIYNRTTSAIVSNSMGVPTDTNTGGNGRSLLSAPTRIVATSNTDVCPYATRNGGSNLQTANWTSLQGQGVPVGYITAQRLYGG